MSKSRKKVSSKQNNNQKSKAPLIILSLAGVTLLVLAFVFASQKPAAAPETQVGGSPALAVDQKQVDLGDVPLDTFVEASFQLTNTGTQTLKFTGKPYIEVVEGC